MPHLDHDKRTLRIEGDQTFTPEHAFALFDVLAAYMPTSVGEVLYHASYSETFGADLRAIMREVFKPELIERWES